MRLRTRGRFNVKRLGRALADRVYGTPFDRALERAVRAGRREFVFGWNRGLGDIALGLVPLFAQIRSQCPGSRITVCTRAELAQAFELTDVDRLLIVEQVVRGTPIEPAAAAHALRTSIPADAVVFADPDPTRWLDGRRQSYPPALRWKAQWNDLAARFLPASDRAVIVGAHVIPRPPGTMATSRTGPTQRWQALLSRFAPESGVRGCCSATPPTVAYPQRNVIDLRGRTDFLELLAVIRTRCRVLVAPDSGVLTMAYYLDQRFPLDIVSLWSDPRQGMLKQGCASPNGQLRHTPSARCAGGRAQSDRRRRWRRP